MCYGACYFYTGTFLESPNVETMQDKFAVCLVSPTVHHASVVVCVIPFSIRWLQCARQQYDSLVKNKKIKPIVWRSVFSVGKKKRDVPQPIVECTTDEDAGSPDEVLPFTDGEEEPLDCTSAKVDTSFVAATRSGGPHQRRVYVTTEDMARGAERKLAGNSRQNKRPKLTRSESREVLDPQWCAPILEIMPACVTNVADILIVWPYTFNILKYSLSIVVVVLGAYPPPLDHPNYTVYLAMFYVVSALSTLYSCYWDFKNDWGLFQDRTDYPLLRPQLKYEGVIWYYYLCLVLNPIFRCFWTLSFSPGATSPFLSLFELLRRCMWGILRLEWAQINDDKQNASLLIDSREDKLDAVATRRLNKEAIGASRI